MDFTELLFGTYGRVYASTNIILMLTLMFIVTFRLYVSRKRKAYFSFMISLAIIILQYFLLIWLDLKSDALHHVTDYLAQTLQVISFILVNMAIYQLYNRSTTMHIVIFLSLLILTFVIMAVRFYYTGAIQNLTQEMLMLHNIWMDLYLFLLIFLCFYVITPFIGQTVKYQLSLTIYFIIHLAHMANTYIFVEPFRILSAWEHYLPLFYYGIIFLFIFDRVVELMQAIYQSSITDGLTGAYNRKFFFTRVQQFVQRERPVSIIFCDIDNFKKLNDTQGHQKGDEVLKQVTEILRECTEDIGIVGRYGGEELVVLLTDRQAKPKTIAEQIRKRVEDETIVTVSVGVSTYKKGVPAVKLIEQADQAMYASKTTGKNKVTVYSSKA